MTRTFKLTLSAAIVLAFAAEIPSTVTGLIGLGLSSEARAEVGRPLTPTSVAGVSRRTSRRQDRRCEAGATC